VNGSHSLARSRAQDDLHAVTHEGGAAVTRAESICASADSTCKVSSSRYVTAVRAVSRPAGRIRNLPAPGRVPTVRPTISPQVRGRAWLTTVSPQTKRNYAVLGGTVAMMAIGLADQRECG
jgi:hypothetical protein